MQKKAAEAKKITTLPEAERAAAEAGAKKEKEEGNIYEEGLVFFGADRGVSFNSVTILKEQVDITGVLVNGRRHATEVRSNNEVWPYCLVGRTVKLPV